MNASALMVALAVAAAPSESMVFDNALTVLDDHYYALRRAHFYEFWVAGGQEVTVRLSGAIAVSTKFHGFAADKVLVAPAGSSGEVKIAVPIGSRRLISLHLGSDGAVGDYSLEVSPAPLEVQRQPPSKASRATAVAKAEARGDSFARAASVRPDFDEVRERREARKKAMETQCKSPRAVFLREALSDGERFTFCDQTTVTRSADNKWSVTFAQEAADFQAFTAIERANVDTARHNAKILKTAEAERQVDHAISALRARTKLFITTERWPEAKYLSAARAYRPSAR